MKWISSLWDCRCTERPRHHSYIVSTYNRCVLNPASIWTLCFTAQMLVTPEVTSVQKDVDLTCPDSTSCPQSDPTSGQELRPFLSPRPWVLCPENPSKQARRGQRSNIARPCSGEDAQPHYSAHLLLSLVHPAPLAGPGSHTRVMPEAFHPCKYSAYCCIAQKEVWTPQDQPKCWPDP